MVKKKKYSKRLKENIKKKGKTIKKKVCEIFNIKTKKKSKEVKTCGTYEEAVVSKGQIKHHEKLLRNILIFVGVLVLIVLGIYLGINSARDISYDGIVEFETQSYCATKPCLIVYKTDLPVTSDGKSMLYNFYFRTHPNELERIPFKGKMRLEKNAVIEANGDFGCSGYGNIAIQNLNNLYDLLGVSMIKDENASCDPENRYIHISLIESNYNGVEQISDSCYNIHIKDCEILKGTEKFMAEILKYTHENIL